MNDLDMIAAAQKGDVPSFNQLVRGYQSIVYHTAYRVLGDGDAASDATQDAFVNAYKNIRSFRGGLFKAWLLRIVTNTCYDQLRAKKRKPTTSLDALLVEPDNPAPGLGEAREESPHEHAERSELAYWIDKGLQTLPYDQRMTLVLSDIDGFAYEEIAEATSTNVGTVKSRLSCARAHMRDFLLEQQELLPDSFRLRHRTEETPSLRKQNV